MRSKKSIYTVVTIIISQIMVTVYSLYLKSVFLTYFQIELLGVTGLIDTFIQSLNIVQASFGVMLLHDLYKPFAEKKQIQIVKILNIYNKIFNYISWLFLMFALIISPFLTNIFKISYVNIFVIYFVFYMQVLAAFLKFRMYYKIIVFKVNQDEYISNIVIIVLDFIYFILKIFAIVYLRSFLIYISLVIVYAVCLDYINMKIIEKKYTFINEKLIFNSKDLVEYGIFTRFKKYFIRLVYDLTYYSMDNYIISIILSTSVLGYVSNYTMIIATVSTFLNTIAASFRGALGNFIHVEKDSDQYFKLYKGINLFFYFIVSIFVVGLFTMLDGFISLWIGEEYLISGSVTLLLIINLMIDGIFKMSENIFIINGYMYKERLPLIVSVFANLVISIVLVNEFGLTGIYIGTLIGNLIYWMGKSYHLCTGIFKKYKWQYLGQILIFLIISITELIGIPLILSYLVPNVNSLMFFIIKTISIIIIVSMINLLLFSWTKTFKFMFCIIKSNIKQ